MKDHKDNTNKRADQQQERYPSMESKWGDYNHHNVVEYSGNEYTHHFNYSYISFEVVQKSWRIVTRTLLDGYQH